MRCAVLCCICILLFTVSNAQKKLVIMGSSTAAGTGASSYNNSWAGKTTSFYNQNTSDGVDTTVTNIALGGLNTYHEMPTDFVPPPGRPSPDINRNVNKALSFSPDVVIINLPTNDMASAYTKIEFMNNLRTMYQRITTAGVRCYIATSQPRTDLGDVWRDSLRTLRDSIINTFGLYSIDFWTDLVSNDGLNNIAAAVSAGDGIHVNDAGHDFLFNRVKNKNIFLAVVLPVQLLAFNASAANDRIELQWKTTGQTSNTFFELQKSTDGSNFNSLTTITARENSTTYASADLHPAAGINYYRLKITEDGAVRFSNTISASYKKSLRVTSIFHINRQTLGITLQPGDEKIATFIITNTNGIIIEKKQVAFTNGINTLSLPVGTLAKGIYFITVQTDSKRITNTFVH